MYVYIYALLHIIMTEGANNNKIVFIFKVSIFKTIK